jgi:hypothetical protein
MEKEFPSTVDFERRFFEGAEVVTVEIKILKETYEEMVAILERSGWDLDKGFRILLAQGLGYAKGQLFLEANDEERARMAKRLAERESMYAVMKFETFNFMRDNQVLEMREAALRQANVGLEGVVKRLRAENDALSEETRRLREHIQALEERLALVEAPPQQVPSRSRFVRFIRSLVCRLC